MAHRRSIKKPLAEDSKIYLLLEMTVLHPCPIAKTGLKKETPWNFAEKYHPANKKLQLSG